MSAPSSRELIDVVDRTTGEPVGTIARGRALAEGADFRTVHVFVRDMRGRLLLQRLSDHRERHPGRWGSSVAAYPYAGESGDQAARRRLAEEVGLYTPLARAGRLVVRDESSHKHVELFVTESDQATVEEPAHIAELRWWTRVELDEEIRTRAERFTPTFLALYALGRDYLDHDGPD